MISMGITISTLGSHCSLQVLKGAKDEGFNTLLICEKKRYNLYKRFSFIDKLLLVDTYHDIINQEFQNQLSELNCVLIPHGTLISYLKPDQIESIKIPIFGNKYILRWEADRFLKQKLMINAKLNTPKSIDDKFGIDKLCIAKLHGAAGGKGYFLAHDRTSFEQASRKLINERIISDESDLYLQEYVIGVPVFIHYFFSPLSNDIELMGADRRYESDIDGIGRIPSQQQNNITLEPTYNVIGNIPIVLRESLLTEIYEMGDNFVEASKNLVSPGIVGPFCLEGVYTSDAKFISFEFSARIVAGTNLYVNGSQYSNLFFDKEMSMGKRIATEINRAIINGKLDKVLT